MVKRAFNGGTQLKKFDWEDDTVNPKHSYTLERFDTSPVDVPIRKTFSQAAQIAANQIARTEHNIVVQREWRNDGSAKWEAPKRAALASATPKTAPVPAKVDWAIASVIERWKRNRK